MARAYADPPDVTRRDAPVVRNALLRFVGSSLVSLIVLSLGAIFVSQHIAEEEALRDARERAASVAHSLAAPMVDERVRAGAPRAVARLATVLRNRMRDGAVVHIKLWSEDGSVVWSDDTAEIGRRYKLTPQVQDLFGTRVAVSERSDAEGAEEVGERDESPLVEVYVGSRDADGVPLVVESYLSPESVQRDVGAIISQVLPLGLGALLVFQITVLPLAVSLARDVRKGQVERAAIARHALLSSELERRRIAQDLHDGVVQDLAGLGYALPAVAAMIVDGPEGDTARRVAGQISGILERDVLALRTLLTDIYPPDLADEGLGLAIARLADDARQSGLQVVAEVEDGLDLPLEAAEIVYRVVREGLRNVVAHADAARVRVEVARHGDVLDIRVTDDGRGVPEGGARPGHLGLRLLGDSLEFAGGELTLRGAPTRGAELHARVPVSAPEAQAPSYSLPVGARG
jgi:signal transduction histidine kinase